MSADDPPNELLAGLRLLDRQLLDVDGCPAGKVDDLELDLANPDGQPGVVAILSGPGALAGRVGGRIGTWLGALHRRLQDEPARGAARLPFQIVRRIDEEVEVRLSRDRLESNHGEEWTRDVIISKIPGARHAPQ
jgi:hypothetical protein